MKSQVIGLDPTLRKSPNLDRFLDVLALFRKRGVFTRASIASIVQPALYAVPYTVYLDFKPAYRKEAHRRLTSLVSERLGLDSVQILASDSQATETHVEQLSRHARRIGADALVLGSNDRTGLSRMFLGSFSETAALIADIPVFVVKPAIHVKHLSFDVRFVLAVDVAAPPTANAVRWIADFAKPSRATLDLVYVVPRARALVKSLQNRMKRKEALKLLTKLEAAFSSQGIEARKTVLPESKSIAQTIVDFSDERKAWLTIATAPRRSGARRLLLGSNARKILALTKRPFLSLRMN